jgi:hypothetical protein
LLSPLDHHFDKVSHNSLPYHNFNFLLVMLGDQGLRHTVMDSMLDQRTAFTSFGCKLCEITEGFGGICIAGRGKVLATWASIWKRH